METIERVARFIGAIVLVIISLPFLLIDYIFIDFWYERRAKKWRNNPRVGDTVVFERGSKRIYTIKALQRKDSKDRLAQVEYVGWGVRTSSWHSVSRLYPTKSH